AQAEVPDGAKDPPDHDRGCRGGPDADRPVEGDRAVLRLGDAVLLEGVAAADREPRRRLGRRRPFEYRERSGDPKKKGKAHDGWLPRRVPRAKGLRATSRATRSLFARRGPRRGRSPLRR